MVGVERRPGGDARRARRRPGQRRRAPGPGGRRRRRRRWPRAPHTLELDLDIERSAARCRWRARACTPAGTPTTESCGSTRRTQASTSVRAAIAAKLGLPLAKVEVIAPGRRRRLRREDHAPVAGGDAGADGRDRGSAAPVKWTEDRREHFISSRPRARPAAAHHGRVRRRRPDLGARRARSGTTTAPTRRTGSSCPIVTSTQLLGPYKPGAYRVEFYSRLHQHGDRHAVPRRRAGRRACFAMERTMDRDRRRRSAWTGPRCARRTSSSPTSSPTTRA